MQLLFLIIDFAVLAIGVFLITKHYRNGWIVPPVLSGVAFVLITLSHLLAMV